MTKFARLGGKPPLTASPLSSFRYVRSERIGSGAVPTMANTIGEIISYLRVSRERQGKSSEKSQVDRQANGNRELTAPTETTMGWCEWSIHPCSNRLASLCPPRDL